MFLDQIQVFQTVVQTKSFRGAAENLNRAQSAVSYAIRRLEEEFELQLFDRSQYRAKLTPAGEAFYKRSLVLIESAQELESYARSLGKGCEPQLRLAVSALFPLSPILKSFDQLRWRFPKTEVRLTVDILGADRLLLENQVDLAITELKGPDSEIENYELCSIEMIAVASAQHPLAKKKVPPDELKKYRQIALRSSPLAEERSAGILSPTNVWSVTDFSSKKELLLAALGWGYMPLHLISADLRSGSLVKVLNESLPVSFFLSHKKTKTRGPSAQFLWESFKQIKI